MHVTGCLDMGGQRSVVERQARIDRLSAYRWRARGARGGDVTAGRSRRLTSQGLCLRLYCVYQIVANGVRSHGQHFARAESAAHDQRVPGVIHNKMAAAHATRGRIIDRADRRLTDQPEPGCARLAMEQGAAADRLSRCIMGSTRALDFHEPNLTARRRVARLPRDTSRSCYAVAIAARRSRIWLAGDGPETICAASHAWHRVK